MLHDTCLAEEKETMCHCLCCRVLSYPQLSYYHCPRLQKLGDFFFWKVGRIKSSKICKAPLVVYPHQIPQNSYSLLYNSFDASIQAEFMISAPKDQEHVWNNETKMKI